VVGAELDHHLLKKLHACYWCLRLGPSNVDSTGSKSRPIDPARHTLKFSFGESNFFAFAGTELSNFRPSSSATEAVLSAETSPWKLAYAVLIKGRLKTALDAFTLSDRTCCTDGSAQSRAISERPVLSTESSSSVLQPKSPYSSLHGTADMRQLATDARTAGAGCRAHAIRGGNRARTDPLVHKLVHKIIIVGELPVSKGPMASHELLYRK
jgi:hypothetical protein